MISRLTTAYDLMPLFKIEDDVEETFPCERQEWLQWLVQNVADEKIAVFAKFEGNRILSYVVGIDNVNPPLQDSAMIIYLWSIDHKSLIEIQEAGEKWAKERGAKRITARTNLPEEFFEAFGYKVTAKFVEKKIG